MNEGFDEGRVSDRRRRGSQEPGTQRFVPAVARMAWAEVMKNPPTPPKPPHDGMTGRRGHFTREVYKEDGPGRRPGTVARAKVVKMPPPPPPPPPPPLPFISYTIIIKKKQTNTRKRR